jgi:acyl-[acyl-carrier-protein] desaturase
VDDAALLAELAPAAEQLLDRHCRSAREWFPHQLVPWSRGRDMPPGQAPPSPSPLLPGVASALVVNVLTEDNLPYYVLGIHRQLGGGVWWDWLRRWTAEEMRHAAAIRDYLSVTAAVDLVGLERARMDHAVSGSVPETPGPIDALVYLSFQELATRIAHWNTGHHLGDDAGRALMQRVAADENLHHLFYRDLVSAALALDPSCVVLAVDRQMRHFTMPGADVPGFSGHARAIAEAGIFSTEILVEQVLAPVALRHWHLEEPGRLSPEAERARDRSLAFLERLCRVAGRLSGPEGAGGPGTGDGGAPTPAPAGPAANG